MSLQVYVVEIEPIDADRDQRRSIEKMADALQELREDGVQVTRWHLLRDESAEALLRSQHLQPRTS